MTQVSHSDIQDFIATQFLNGRRVEIDEDLLLSGLLDSLGVMSLVAFLEKQSGKQIPPQDITIENFTSVSTISDYLNAN